MTGAARLKARKSTGSVDFDRSSVFHHVHYSESIEPSTGDHPPAYLATPGLLYAFQNLQGMEGVQDLPLPSRHLPLQGNVLGQQVDWMGLDGFYLDVYLEAQN